LNNIVWRLKRNSVLSENSESCIRLNSKRRHYETEYFGGFIDSAAFCE
jgi:hypothetical protein